MRNHLALASTRTFAFIIGTDRIGYQQSYGEPAHPLSGIGAITDVI